jgi:hypothetical protein
MNSLWDIRIFLGLVPKESPCTSTPPLGLLGLFWGEIYLYLYLYFTFTFTFTLASSPPLVPCLPFGLFQNRFFLSLIFSPFLSESFVLGKQLRLFRSLCKMLGCSRLTRTETCSYTGWKSHNVWLYGRSIRCPVNLYLIYWRTGGPHGGGKQYYVTVLCTGCSHSHYVVEGSNFEYRWGARNIIFNRPVQNPVGPTKPPGLRVPGLLPGSKAAGMTVVNVIEGHMYWC